MDGKPERKPEIVEHLGDRVEAFAASGRYVYLKLKGSEYDYFLYGRGSAGLYRVYSILAVYTVCDEDHMDESMDPVYRLLKGFECVWDRRKKTFTSNPSLFQLKEFIPELEISDRLASSLNGDQEVNRLLAEVEPNSISITLFSLPPEYQPFRNVREAVLKGMVEFYKLPLAIRWNVSLVKTHPLLSKPPIQPIFSLLEAILRVIKSEVEKALSLHSST